MKTAICAFSAVFCTLVYSCQPLLNLRETGPSAGLNSRKEAAVFRKGYKMVQRFNPSNYSRSVYLQRKTDKEPVLVYTHERGIEATLGHRGRLVLINDYFATKACKIIVADVDSKNNWRIDEEACRYHLHTAPKEWFPCYAIPKAIAFSRDDKMMLVAMKSGYVAGSPEGADRFAKGFQLWSYVVDSEDGTVLHAYRTDGTVPHNWWTF